MGWESRQQGGSYYFRSVRRGKRVTKEYLGSGPLAELAARMDQAKREERAAGRLALRRVREEDAVLEKLLEELADGTDLLAQVALIAAGCHRHKRQWRRRRGRSSGE